MGRKIPLGTQIGTTSGQAIISKPNDLEEMMSAIQSQLERLTSILYDETPRIQRSSKIREGSLNKDGLPIGLSFIGTSLRGGTVTLTVAHDGYLMGQQKFDSLSQAAEATSGVRRSGWTFWRLADGRTIKEVFGRT